MAHSLDYNDNAPSGHSYPYLQLEGLQWRGQMHIVHARLPQILSLDESDIDWPSLGCQDAPT